MEDVYKAPEADLQPELESSNQLHFIVSQRKLWVMNIVTFGLYDLVWNYYHWRHIKYADETEADIWPVPRAVFSIFFVSSLFNRFSETCERNHREYTWPHTLYATIYVVMAIASYIMDRLPIEVIDETYAWIAITIGFLAVTTFAISRAQEAANVAMGDVQGNANDHFTAANIIWILIGGLFWALILAPDAILSVFE